MLNIYEPKIMFSWHLKIKILDISNFKHSQVDTYIYHVTEQHFVICLDWRDEWRTINSWLNTLSRLTEKI